MFLFFLNKIILKINFNSNYELIKDETWQENWNIEIMQFWENAYSKMYNFKIVPNFLILIVTNQEHK